MGVTLCLETPPSHLVHTDVLFLQAHPNFLPPNRQMSWKSEHVSAEPLPSLGIYSASASLLFPPLNGHCSPKGTAVSLRVNPPEPPQPSLSPALAAFSFSKYRLALAPPAPSCRRVTTHPPASITSSVSLRPYMSASLSVLLRFFMCVL